MTDRDRLEKQRLKAIFPESSPRKPRVKYNPAKRMDHPLKAEIQLAPELARLNSELQRRLAEAAQRLLHTELETETAQQHFEFVCPILHIAGSDKAQDLMCGGVRLMNEPVIAADGVTYERRNIEAWIARQLCLADGVVRSPLTNEIFAHAKLSVDHELTARMLRAVQVEQARGKTSSQRQRHRDRQTVRERLQQQEMETMLMCQRARETERNRQASELDMLHSAFELRVSKVIDNSLHLLKEGLRGALLQIHVGLTQADKVVRASLQQPGLSLSNRSREHLARCYTLPLPSPPPPPHAY
eukprot:CAMPEP_0173114038 /NCGR_PEP_ID=MMETSP1102-20130122/47342_1 /TAXON_ID=49646 /ORGANISM="Geminigera sp., Strain Caron Lab Isolate" /LENGTH=299 /DNA_ID=CAMNT_0014016157 /DNA_START=21 /DNA_END=920 /DNA_ORIENTATION=-